MKKAAITRGLFPERCGIRTHDPKLRRLVRQVVSISLFSYQLRLLYTCMEIKATYFYIYFDLVVSTNTVQGVRQGVRDILSRSVEVFKERSQNLYEVAMISSTFTLLNVQ